MKTVRRRWSTRRWTSALRLSAITVLAVGVSRAEALPGPHLAPLAETSLTPPGWSPLGLGAIQISVPSDWYVEDPGYICGGTAGGMVFIDQSPAPPRNGTGCPLTSNVVELSTATLASLPNSHRTVINSIPVLEEVSGPGAVPVVSIRAFGMQIDAKGPLAHQVVETLTHSPLSVLLKSSVRGTPSGWRQVVFGGLRLAVPGQWVVERENAWGGCPGNIAARVLVLSTARYFSAPGCPGPLETAGYLAASPGMVLGSGPQVDTSPKGATCLTRNMLRICIDPPPPPAGGFVPGHELNLLTAQVRVPGQVASDQIEIGLTGTGIRVLSLFDSMRPAS